ncbi:MAG: DUF6249 domain-containing protein [Bacteroidota bacterium]
MEHIEEMLTAVGVLGIIGYTAVTFTKMLTDYFLRKKIVDKGLESTDVSAFFKTEDKAKYSALKWGLIILFGGIGLMLIELMPYSDESPMPYGVIATSIAIGFLTYYFIVKKEIEKENP